MIFPGMDPYLEEPRIWPGVHTSLMVYIRDQLQPLLRPRYVASLEERVYVEGPQPREIVADVAVRHGKEGTGTTAVLEADAPVIVELPALEIHEPFVQILDRHEGLNIVTVIEVISPSNKFPGTGRDAYLAKQLEVRSSTTHLVEIDLLRIGNHVASVAEWAVRGRGPYDYLICVNRAGGVRGQFELYPRGLRDRLPRIRVPLAGADADIVLDMQAALEKAYNGGDYASWLSYDQPCRPPLTPEDQEWADQLIRAARSQPS